jgi:general secretion pathway protein D
VKKIAIILILFLSANLYANCQSKFFSFKINNSKSVTGTILNVLEGLTRECKMSLIFTDEKARKLVNKKINYLNVNDSTINDVLDLVLTENNLFYTITDRNILKVSYMQTKTFYIDYISFTNRSSKSSKTIQTGSSDGGDGSTSLNSESKFKLWDEIKEEMHSILNANNQSQTPSKAIINQDAGLITVTGTSKQLSRIQNYIDILTNRLHKQVLIDAKIIEVTYSSDSTTGIDWSKFEDSLNGVSN